MIIKLKNKFLFLKLKLNLFTLKSILKLVIEPNINLIFNLLIFFIIIIWLKMLKFDFQN